MGLGRNCSKCPSTRFKPPIHELNYIIIYFEHFLPGPTVWVVLEEYLSKDVWYGQANKLLPLLMISFYSRIEGLKHV